MHSERSVCQVIQRKRKSQHNERENYTYHLLNDPFLSPTIKPPSSVKQVTRPEQWPSHIAYMSDILDLDCNNAGKLVVPQISTSALC